ncbi:MAG TPA: hypothetical protein VJ787_13030 [Thermoleophilia bacterium]|nr:hypothetical protein [Thermoleophilia bacterium]
MLSQLHDEIDQLEDLRNETRATVERVFRENLDRALASTPTPVEALTVVTHMVEAALAGLTTKAFDAGLKFSDQRTEVANG